MVNGGLEGQVGKDYVSSELALPCRRIGWAGPPAGHLLSATEGAFAGGPQKTKWAGGPPGKQAAPASLPKGPLRPRYFCVPIGAPAVPAWRGAMVRRSAAPPVGGGGGGRGPEGEERQQGWPRLRWQRSSRQKCCRNWCLIDKKAQIPHRNSPFTVQIIRPLSAFSVSFVRNPKSHIAIVPLLCRPFGHSAQPVFY